jgi:hypothetical protein
VGLLERELPGGILDAVEDLPPAGLEGVPVVTTSRFIYTEKG